MSLPPQPFQSLAPPLQAPSSVPPPRQAPPWPRLPLLPAEALDPSKARLRGWGELVHSGSRAVSGWGCGLLAPVSSCIPPETEAGVGREGPGPGPERRAGPS